MIADFATLVDRDTSPNKERAMRELSYIFHVCSYESPYLAYGDGRAEKVQNDLGIEPDEVLRKAMVKYKELSKSPLVHLLEAAMDACMKLKDYFLNIDFDEIDDATGKNKYNVKDVVATLSALPRAVEGIEKLTEQMERNQKDSRNRKQVEVNAFSE